MTVASVNLLYTNGERLGEGKIMARPISSDIKYLKGQVSKVADDLKKYWPLTLRQIFYQLVAAGIIENAEKEYKRLSRVTTAMRTHGEMSWAVMEDRTRRAVEKERWTDKTEFIREHLDGFLRGYSRCLVQQQEKYVELWTEKDALSRMFESVGIPYCVIVVTCKGHLSTTFIKEYADRAIYAIEKRRQRPVIVYGGDLDPSGWRIPVSIKERLWEQHGVDVELDRFALNDDQVQSYGLPHNPNALKWSDPNVKKYVARFGRQAVELDALHPAALESEIKSALSRHLDVESLNGEEDIQKREREELREIRNTVIDAIENMVSI